MTGYKKFGIAMCAIVGGVIGGSYLYAQEEPGEQPGLEHVRVRFCNDQEILGGTKTVTLTGSSEDNLELCLYVFNTYVDEISVSLNLVDGAITNDALQNKACKDETSKEQLGQYAIFSGDQTTFALSGQSVIQTVVGLDIPEYYAGMYYGCITAQVTNNMNQTGSGSMFTIVNRLGYPFELLIDGELVTDFAFRNFDGEALEVGSYQTRGASSIMALLEREDQMYGYLVAQNDGNIAQTVTISGAVTLWQGYPWAMTYDIEYTQQAIPGEEMAIFLPTVERPRYGGPVTFDVAIAHQPMLDFVSDNITDEMRQTQKQNLYQTYRVIPLWWYVAGAMIVYILWKIMARLLQGSSKNTQSPQKEITMTVEEYKALKKHKKKKKKKKKKKTEESNIHTA